MPSAFALTQPAQVESMISAKVHTDDRVFEISFDAEPWFAQATEQDIFDLASCGWGDDYPSDDIAMWFADSISDIDEMFSYIERVDGTVRKTGFECYINVGDVMKWLDVNNYDLAKKLRANEDINTGGQ